MIFWTTTFHLTLWLDSNQIERSHVIHLGTMCKSSSYEIHTHTNSKTNQKSCFAMKYFLFVVKNVFLTESHWHYLFTHSWMIFIRCSFVKDKEIFFVVAFSFIQFFRFRNAKGKKQKNNETKRRKIQTFLSCNLLISFFFSFFFKSTFTTKWMFLWYFFEGTIELKYNVHSVSSKMKRKKRNFQTTTMIIIMLVVVKVWRRWWWSCLRI